MNDEFRGIMIGFAVGMLAFALLIVFLIGVVVPWATH